METTRETLSQLLNQLEARPRDHQARLTAAGQALALCVGLGDPLLADVAESLVADAPRRLPGKVRRELSHLAARARASRRAVAMAHRTARQAPDALARSLAADPELLAAQIRRRLDQGETALARAVLEVALARFATHKGLIELRESLLEAWPQPGSMGPSGEPARDTDPG